MKTDVPSTIFDSFNARSLEPWQVAETFVASRHYDTLTARRHSLIVGPRGSGKTTLLKMLQQLALEAWRHPLANSYRAKIDYTGVFIPTDRGWGAQIESLGYGRLDVDAHRIVGIAVFTTHVLRALVTAMLHRLGRDLSEGTGSHRRVILDRDREIEIAHAIGAAWQFSLAVPTLAAIKYALTQRLSDIRALANIEAYRTSDGRMDRLSAPWLHLHFLQSAGVAAELFDDATRSVGKWALLFDELELAPDWIRTELFRSLRSTDPRFLFKLSISPYNNDADEFSHASSPQGNQDFDEIILWYSEKDDNTAFSSDLWTSMLATRGLPLAAPAAVLGRSEVETPREEWADTGTAYTPNSRLIKRLRKLRRNDVSFARFLERRGVDLDAAEKVSRGDRAALLRKVAPLAAVREAFRTPDGRNVPKPTRRTRTRKSVKIYTGAAAVFAILEGNPRWFIAIVGRLLDSYKDGRVTRLVQATEIEDAANRFRAMLRTLPAHRLVRSYQPRGLLTVLDRIGKYFFQRAVTDDFDPDPPATFIVDAASSVEVADTLGVALNAGAIILLRDSDTSAATPTVLGRRFRLSYLLAPSYGIPLRLGRPVSLTRVLRGNVEQATLPIGDQ
jgi:energy-coupling factor transporter ATP-binding protein EcfA2